MRHFNFKAKGITEELEESISKHRHHTSQVGTSKVTLGSVSASTALIAKVLLILLALYIVSSPAPRIDSRRIQLDLPPGATSKSKLIEIKVSDRLFQVRGTVIDKKFKTVRLIENGHERTLRVDETGRFSAPVALLSGRNRINVIAGPFASQTLNVTAQIPKTDIWAQLTWDGPGDIDLHLRLPSGADCFFQNDCLQPIGLEGAKLDIDNRESFGPEHITVTDARPGYYSLGLVYFKATQSPAILLHWQLNLLLENGRIARHFSGTVDTEDPNRTIEICSFDFSNGRLTSFRK
jgi:uncharacterized protein YfaP (DUF2135 family)